jgi:hypothetical protein
MEEFFRETAYSYNSIYRDDGLAIFNGNKSKQDIITWLKTFQQQVKDVTGYGGLQFTVSLWGLDKEDGASHDTVSIE